MSAEITSERVCYVHCNFCNTILAVSVPCSSAIVAIVTVRCGHCSNLLSVNMGALLQSPPPPLVHHLNLQDHFQKLQHQKQQQYMNSNNNHLSETHLVNKDIINNGSSSSSSSSSKADVFGPFRAQHSKMPLPIRPPEKRQRVPSAYNRFIKEEIQRIKSSNPDISHREAFSMAAKNWAHFPHIHFGRKLESNKQGGSNKMN